MAKAKATPPASNTPPAAAASPGTENAAVPGADGAGDTQAFNGLRITSSREGFRRAGRPWSVAPIDVPLAELTDDQVAMLRAEPMLTVEDITIEAAAE